MKYPLGEDGPVSMDRIYTITVDGISDVFREEDEPLIEEGDYDIPQEKIDELYDSMMEEYA